ncbi:MAG TPA: enoyl-CoA hydratase [Burkholderiales bacterium]|nr:enoyl-CoA hydratase [Burkholderiales bacterium]
MSTETLTDSKILSKKNGPIGHLIFNNPEKRNAFSLDMSLAAADVLEDFLKDDAIRVIVLSGAGDKAFVSGGDISKFEQARATKEQVENYTKTGDRFRTLLKGSAKPTIAMIRGYCLGGGMAIALNCDLRICTEDASFGIPASKLGIGYASDRLGQLVDLVGPSAAKDLLFTGRRCNAQEALRLGIVNYVLASDELENFVQSYAGTIANNAPLSILASKRVIDEYVKDADKRDNKLADRVVADCFASQDYIEGRRAFMEKRKAAFTGR